MSLSVDSTDLQKRWRPLSSDEAERADVLLQDALAVLRSECTGIEDRITAGTLDENVVILTVCAMVKRAMQSGVDAGVATTQDTAGPFSRSLTFSNPAGDLYLTRADRRRVGFGGQKAFSVDLAPSAGILPRWDY